MAFCQDATITHILRGKQVTELLEIDKFFLLSVFYMYHDILQKLAELLVPSKLYAKTYPYIKGHSQLLFGYSITASVQ